MGLFGNTTPAPQPSSADPFAKIEASDGKQGGVYPLAGVYPLLYVDALKMIRSRKGEDMFVCEVEILRSEVADRPFGTRMSWIGNFRHDATAGNVKTLIAAVMNCPQAEVDSAGAQYACSDKNPCHGRLVRLEAVGTKTKAGGDFTLCNWRALPDEIQAQAEALRKAAGFI